MKITVTEKREYDAKILAVKAGVRYWEDAYVDGVEDTEGTLVSCRDGDYWCPVIDLDTGQITNWTQGITADIHYKVCDDGEYCLYDSSGKMIVRIDDYVPQILCPKENGYGDYIIMEIDSLGYIKDFRCILKEFTNEEEE